MRLLPFALLVLIAACSSSIPLSGFEESQEVVGKVLENDDGCVVDATCALTLEFANATVVAAYGHGERAVPCDIPLDVSNAAFDAKKGDIVRAIIGSCGEEGYSLKHIEILE